MPINTEDWTYAEFHAFVMLYAANTDGHITWQEENLIRPTLTEEAYQRIKAAFMSCDDAVALNAILSCRDRFFPTKTEKDKILADMKDIYKADQVFSQLEARVLHMFERVI